MAFVFFFFYSIHNPGIEPELSGFFGRTHIIKKLALRVTDQKRIYQPLSRKLHYAITHHALTAMREIADMKLRLCTSDTSDCACTFIFTHTPFLLSFVSPYHAVSVALRHFLS